MRVAFWLIDFTEYALRCLKAFWGRSSVNLLVTQNTVCRIDLAAQGLLINQTKQADMFRQGSWQTDENLAIIWEKKEDKNYVSLYILATLTKLLWAIFFNVWALCSENDHATCNSTILSVLHDARFIKHCTVQYTECTLHSPLYSLPSTLHDAR